MNYAYIEGEVNPLNIKLPAHSDEDESAINLMSDYIGEVGREWNYSHFTNARRTCPNPADSMGISKDGKYYYELSVLTTEI